ILLVQPQPGERLDDALQLRKRELVLDQLEDQRTVAQLAAQSCQAGGEDAPVIVGHRLAEQRRGPGRRAAAVRPRLVGQAGAVEQLVALEYPVAVPAGTAEAEADLDPFVAVRPLV